MERDIYIQKDGKIKPVRRKCSTIDGHCHSYRSNQFIPHKVTKFLGVRECYTPVKKISKVLEERGMDFQTISDHDEVEGALELRRLRRKKGSENVIVNCEYTVAIQPNGFDQVIHINCWGLDYANGAVSPLSDHEVRDWHKKLLHQCRFGEKEFIKFCKGEGIPYVKSHTAMSCSPKKLLTGKQLYDLREGEKRTEINSDTQLENLIALDIAQRNNSSLCAGTDAHTALRLGNQFTVAWKLDQEGKPVPVETPAELVDAFDQGNTGIGSSKSLPENKKDPSLADIVFYQFNWTTRNLQKDTKEGWKGHILYENGWRKWSLVGAALGIPTALICAPFILPSIPLALSLSIGGGMLTAEAFVSALLSWGIPAKERYVHAKRARKLYADFNEYIAHLETAPQKERIIELEKRIEELNNQITANQTSIQETYEYYTSKELPVFNPKLRGFTKLAHGFVEKMCGENTEDMVYNTTFTEPIEKEQTAKNKSEKKTN
jgi:hypothetical protein